MKLVLASKNPHKLKELEEILSGLGVEVMLESEAGVDVEVEETGTTFEENARLKAKAVCEASGLPAVADDSGLCVDALNGAPGVYSARYGGEGLDDPGRCRLLLENLRGQLLLLPQWGHRHRPGGVPRHHRLRPQGGERLRLRPDFLPPRPEKDLCPAHPRGEERHLSPGQRAAGI